MVYIHKLKYRDYQSRLKKQDPTIGCVQASHIKYKDR